VSLTPHARKSAVKKSNYILCEYEAELKMASARDSGAQGGLFGEKTEGRKSLDAVPLNHTYSEEI
jgi:hypothetical protein